MRFSDFKGLFEKSTITVENIDNPYEDYYVIDFKPGHARNWLAGEHGIFSIPEQKISGKKWRAFSVASIPEEGIIRIGTRTGKEISSFKDKLIHLKKGDKVSMRGPFGWFKIQEDLAPIVLIAGGVGITPIKALLEQLKDATSREIVLIYSSKEYYLFEEALKAIEKSNDQVKIIFTENRDETSEAVDARATVFANEAYYYISGAPTFIKGVKSALKDKGINSSRIINDPFMGY